MGQTDIYKLRWPERTGVAADGPDGYKDLATDVENQMIRMRSRTYAQGQITIPNTPVPPGQTKTLMDFNLVPPVAGWVQVEWWWSAQWKAGTWHGGTAVASLGVPGLDQSTRASRWCNYGFAMNGQYAGRLVNPTTNRLGQRFLLSMYTDPGSDPAGNFAVYRAGYCIQHYGGNPVATTNSYQIGHRDYVNNGSSPVTSYSITPDPATAYGDWMYLIHMHRRETADITPGMPSGFAQIVSPQLSGSVASGMYWTIWRKKRAVGDPASHTVTLSSARHVRATLITVRSPNDVVPTVGSFTASRAGVNPSRVTVPGGVAVQPGALVLTVAVQNTVSAANGPPQPPTVTGSSQWFWVANTGGDTVFLDMATRSYTDAMNTDPVVFAWTKADVGIIGGVSLIFHPA
jgi:hypothetical protein